MMGNSELQLRGVQAPALEAIQQGQSPVVAVMPTGGGKSLLFMLPAWISPRGVTVVVVPLIALRGDMVHRCRQLGISSVAWESRRPADQASIVLVTPESAITEDFMTFLNRQRLCHRLDRIVIDECHVVLNDQTNFRPAMAQLGRLLVAQAQMIYLTATLPPTAENQLFQRLRTSREKVHLFRSRTHRMNVAYRLWQPTCRINTPIATIG
jgi:superfamily II DNA helicase RecQ